MLRDALGMDGCTRTSASSGKTWKQSMPSICMCSKAVVMITL